MHRTNGVEWLSEKFRKAEEEEGEQDSEIRPTWMYHQYKTTEEIERKMRVGEVLSGFTFRGNSDKIMILYGC